MKNDKYEQVSQSDDLINKIWSAILKRQQSIDDQLAVYDKKMNMQLEESNRIIEKSETKIFRRMDKKNLEMKEIDEKIYKQLEENRVKIEEKAEEKEKQKPAGKLSKKKKKIKKKDGTKDETEEYQTIIELDEETAKILNSMSMATHRSPEKLVAELINQAYEKNTVF